MLSQKRKKELRQMLEDQLYHQLEDLDWREMIDWVREGEGLSEKEMRYLEDDVEYNITIKEITK